MEFGILGPLRVLREGEPIEPGSPKQRALLVNLIAHHGQVVSRDRLIEDLWAGSPPSTGLGVLQNYVSQLRKALGADLVATRGPGYVLDVEPSTVDSARFEALMDSARAALQGGEASRAADLARDALALWRGPALADVAGEPFASPAIARLEELRSVAVELQLEAQIVAGEHHQAVAPLEAAVADHPMRERRWWLLMLALYRSGRQADALRAYQRARTVLIDELGVEPSAELRDLERAILEQDRNLDAPVDLRAGKRPSSRRARARGALLGRADEWSAIAASLDDGGDTTAGLLLLIGEPGIGKTRLLEEARHHVEASGGVAIAGRGFAAEHGRPYGAWVDALRAMSLPPLDDALRAGLAPLLPELGAEPVELHDPNRLYAAVVRMLEAMADTAPVAVLLDDVHWMDEPSFALLHYAVRHLGTAGVAFVATARPAELDDNPASAQVVQALRRDDLLAELLVGPLTAAVITELTEPIASNIDPELMAKATNGNPLFALEMAHALARGEEPLTRRLDALIGDRLARIDDRAGALVSWVAAFGRAVPAGTLARLVEHDVEDLFVPLGQLERHGVLRADDDGNIEFVHDLIGVAAYKRLSGPRRALLHARIGATLAALPDTDDSLAAEAARHADAGGDSTTCVAACVRAARRCLRLVAYGDAERVVRLGRSHVERLPDPERVAADLDLIRVLLHPGVRLRDPGDLAEDLTALCADAQRLGLDAELSTGISLLARAHHWGWGDIPRARALMERATTLIEGTSSPDLEPLLEGARCLAYLEMEMERTARLFDQLGNLHALAAGSLQYQWGLGLVEAWRGDTAAARAALRTAIGLATSRGDHWAQFECGASLTLLELEAGDRAAAAAQSIELSTLASKLGQGSELPYATAIEALCRLVDDGAARDLDDAIGELERLDARFLVPDLQGIAAEVYQGLGELDLAKERALAAVDVATEVDRPFEIARAHAVLGCIAAERGAIDDARVHLRSVDDIPGALPGHVEGLRRTAEGLIAARDGT